MVQWEFEGLATIVALVARAVGIALIPPIALADHRDDVVVRQLPPPAPALDIYAVTRTTALRNPAVAATLAALRKAAAVAGTPAGQRNGLERAPDGAVRRRHRRHGSRRASRDAGAN
jgi:hypothetical protein